MLLFNWICCVIIGFLADFPVSDFIRSIVFERKKQLDDVFIVGLLQYLMDPMVLSVLYIWCQLNKDTIVSFWFGTQFKAMYLPWVLLLFNLVIAGGGTMEFVGIVVGHLYFFLAMQYPQEFGGPMWLNTPQILYVPLFSLMDCTETMVDGSVYIDGINYFLSSFDIALVD